MHERLYDRYLSGQFRLTVFEKDGEFVRTGYLTCRESGRRVEVTGYIPRFTQDAYCESFAFQWSRFRDLQHDSISGKDLTLRRFRDNTRWSAKDLEGKSVLECGCGPGRFTEIMAGQGAEVVALDMSRAIDVNLENHGPRENVLLMQADLSDAPFLDSRFDFVFCYGVIQHTPDPAVTFAALARGLAPGGRISADVYRKFGKPSPWSFPKYFWRPITKRLKHGFLLSILAWYIPRYIDFDTWVRSMEKYGELLCGMIPIPCWNYLHSGYTRDERIRHAIMDTFDALSPEYDNPQTLQSVRKWFTSLPGLDDVEVFFGSNGIVANARRRGKPCGTPA